MVKMREAHVIEFQARLGKVELGTVIHVVDDNIVQLGRESFKTCHREERAANIRWCVRADEKRSRLNVLVFSREVPEVKGALWA
jgi:phosphoribosylamine-glycine ligase